MTQPVPLPNDLDAEAAVISAVFVTQAAYYDAQAILGAEDFYSDANRWIWHGLEEIERSGAKVDVVTVAAWLRERGKLEVIGGTPYLGTLTDSTPAIAHVREHALIVAGLAHRRRLMSTLKASAAEGYTDVGDPFAWAQSIEQRVYEAARRKKFENADGCMDALVPAVLSETLARSQGKKDAPGISTGIAELDRRINGLKRKKVYVYAGRPGMGKTALIGQTVTHIASLGMFGVEISTEQGREELAYRKLAQASGVSYKALESGRISSSDWDRVTDQAERLRKLPLVIESLNRPTIGEIRGTIRRAVSQLRRKFGERMLGVIAIDQLQHLDGESRKGENRESEVARLSREIQWMAGEFDCPILLAAQLNRRVEERPDKRPLLSDLRESGAIEQDAFGIFFPFRPKYYERQGRGQSNDGVETEECELIVGKHKNGPAGSVALNFHAPSMSFESPDDRDSGGHRQQRMSYEDGPPHDDPRFAND